MFNSSVNHKINNTTVALRAQCTETCKQTKDKQLQKRLHQSDSLQTERDTPTPPKHKVVFLEGISFNSERNDKSSYI